MLDLEVFEMADKSVRYTPEFKRQMIDLVRGGRTLTRRTLRRFLSDSPTSLSGGERVLFRHSSARRLAADRR
jgi:hypothetical protein